MKATQQNLVSTHFNRGAFVTWQEASGDDALTRCGIVECAMTHKPEWYYVRNEHGDLDYFHWSELTLARRKDS